MYYRHIMKNYMNYIEIDDLVPGSIIISARRPAGFAICHIWDIDLNYVRYKWSSWRNSAPGYNYVSRTDMKLRWGGDATLTHILPTYYEELYELCE